MQRISGPADAMRSAAGTTLGTIATRQRTYTHDLDRSDAHRDRNPDRPGPGSYAADKQFAAG